MVGHVAATVRLNEQSNLTRQGVGVGVRVGVRAAVGATVGAAVSTTSGLWATTNVLSDGATDAAEAVAARGSNRRGYGHDDGAAVVHGGTSGGREGRGEGAEEVDEEALGPRAGG